MNLYTNSFFIYKALEKMLKHATITIVQHKGNKIDHNYHYYHCEPCIWLSIIVNKTQKKKSASINGEVTLE